MDTLKAIHTDSKNNNSHDKWFDDVISGLKVDKMLLDTKTASKEKVKMYETLVNGSQDSIHYLARSQSSIYFITNLLNKYISELANHNKVPLELAFDLSDAKILVWAKVEDDDEKTEDALLLAEAEANASFADFGFFISSTIIERRDNLPIPSHYKAIEL